MNTADEQHAMNRNWQSVGIAALFAVRRQLSGLHGSYRHEGGRIAAARPPAGTPTPPQARAVSLLALGVECAKFLAKQAAKVGPFVRWGGVAPFKPATKDVPGPVGKGLAA